MIARAERMPKVPVSDADISTVYRFGDGGLIYGVAEGGVTVWPPGAPPLTVRAFGVSAATVAADAQMLAFGTREGEVALAEPLGVETVIHIQSGEQTLLSILPGITALKVGDAIKFGITRERLHYFNPDGIRVSA